MDVRNRLHFATDEMTSLKWRVARPMVGGGGGVFSTLVGPLSDKVSGRTCPPPFQYKEGRNSVPLNAA